MTRPHVEFIQAQALAWQPTALPHLAGTQCKVLSRDAESGACTVLLRFPEGFRLEGDWALDSEEEFLVLDGELALGGARYSQDCYALLPSGSRRGEMLALRESVVIAFFNEPPAVPVRAIPRLDAFELPWSCAEMDPAYADVGLRFKMLRGGIGEARSTMLVYCPPHLHPPHWRGPQEVHDCVEEMFLISGDYLSNVGRMREGAYFWRPPGIAHGPYGTRMGNLALIRTIGAPLVNNWTREDVEISREQVARPGLAEPY